MNKHIFQRWLTERNRLDFTGKSINNVPDKRMPLRNFHTHAPLDDGRVAAKTLPEPTLQSFGVVRLHDYDITPDPRLEFIRRPDSDETALMQDAKAITALGFFQNMRGQQNTDASRVAEMGEMGGKIQTGTRIEAGARLVEQQ
jgi:hypothetical protein